MENTNNEKIVKSSIHYYCLNGLYRTMASLASEGQRMYPGDQTYRFYSGCSLAFEGRAQEAIRELDRCINDRDLSMGAILALIYSHNKCQVVDKGAVDILEKKLDQVKRQSNETTLYYGGLFLLLSKNFSEAQKYTSELNETFPNYSDGKVLNGWLIVHDDEASEKSLKTFSEIFSKINEPDVLIILSKVQEKLGDYSGSIAKLNQAIALYPRFLPAFIEKIKIHAILKEFELLMDTAMRALVLDKHSIEPHRYLIINYLIWDFNEELALSRVRDLISSLELREPKNAQLYYESSRMICRLALTNENILIHSSSLIERAVFLDPNRIEFITELAFQCALLKRFQESERHYKNATKLNPVDSKPITGLLLTKLMALQQEKFNDDGRQHHGNLTDTNEENKIHEEIDHLEEFDKTTTVRISIDLLYLCLKSHFLRNGHTAAHHHSSSSSSWLTKIEYYLSQIHEYYQGYLFKKNQNLSVQFLVNLDLYQLTDLVQICMITSCGGSTLITEPLVSGQKIPPILNYGREFISFLANYLPNHTQILYLNAKIKYLMGEISSALNLANRCLKYDSKFTKIYLLIAKISIYDRNFQTAHRCLENALVLDFQVRENISYVLIKSSILKFEKKYDEAIELLENTLQRLDRKSSFKSDHELFINLQIVDIFLMLNKITEARKIIQKLLDRYHDSVSVRSRIQLAQARVFGSIGDYEQSLLILKNIPSEPNAAENFIRSRQMMAAIYLSKYKDRKRFTDCYREVMERFPSQQSQLILGDAYMHILEPEIAIEIYEQALKKNPKDYGLVRKVGQALIKAHFYERAVTYYKAAIKSSGQSLSFCYDLGSLLCRLGRNEPAKDLIQNTLRSFSSKNETELEDYIIKIKLLQLLARVYKQLSEKELSLKTLQQAHSENQKLMRRLPVEHPDLMEEHRNFSIKLCKELAQSLTQTNSHQGNGNGSQYNSLALQVYKDSLAFESSRQNDNENEIGNHFTETYLKMARIEMENENFDVAHGYCTTVLKNRPNLMEAILIMADITFRQGDFEGALNLYQEILNKNPTYFAALVGYIEACRRFGKLIVRADQSSSSSSNYSKSTKIASMLKEAEKLDKKTNLANGGDGANQSISGLHYCNGLYQWYIGNGNEAIKYLSMIRNDQQYGYRATVLIVEICINPDFYNESNDDPYADFRSNKGQQSSSMALKTAETLVQTLKKLNSDDLEIHLLYQLVSLASSTIRKQKQYAEVVLTDLITYASNPNYSEHVGIIYAMSLAYMTLKQIPKARNQLKRIVKHPWKYSKAEYLEKAWLLLTDIHIQANKFDNANELVNKILRYNRSCSKAYEYSGFILEKEQNYRDAALNYEQAWNLCQHSNPSIGYKLAFNYMKSKRYADAIDVCHRILDLQPDFPKIRKEILDKCINNLKS